MISSSLPRKVRMTKNGILCEVDGKRVCLDPKNSDVSGINFVSHAHSDHLPSKNGGTILSSIETNEIANLRWFKMENHVESLDDFSLVTARGLEGGLAALQATVDALEKNYTYKNVFQCEPQLSKHGLYPSMSSKNSGLTVRNMMNLLTYTDGKTDLLAVSEKINITIDEAATIAERMVECGVLKRT